MIVTSRHMKVTLQEKNNGMIYPQNGLSVQRKKKLFVLVALYSKVEAFSDYLTVMLKSMTNVIVNAYNIVFSLIGVLTQKCQLLQAKVVF